ncbi:hypothetical protein [Streptomyces sp. NPDC088789]|uniref:hypothetical protein n=1 Tax=Streptomyces sp. NPDC088789 TaxID=3365899 RepID=UPI0037F36A48
MTVVRHPLPTAPTGPRRLPRPPGRSCHCVALDLGGARTRAWSEGRGTLIDVPTVTPSGAGVPRGALTDVPGTARLLERLLGHRMPRLARPLVVVTTPVLDGPAHRERARAAVGVLHPRAVLTVPTARAVALAVDADLSRPLLVVDLGAHLTEVVLLADGMVFDARRTPLGTADLSGAATPVDLREAVTAMLTSMLRQDRTPLTADALSRGGLLAGGGALRPDLTYRLTGVLEAPLRPVPAPHTAAVRGAALLLRSAHRHPSTGRNQERPAP